MEIIKPTRSASVKGKVAAFGASYFAGAVVLGYCLKRYGRHHHWAKYAWLIEPSVQAIAHTYAVVHNVGLQ